jgi:hypothetical protein
MATVQDLSGNVPTSFKYCAPNRTVANAAAVVTTTPLYSGEIILAQDTMVRYRGLALVAGQWGQVTGELP